MGVKVPIHPLHILSQATAARQHQGQEAGGHGCTVTIEKGGGRNGKLLMVPQPAGTPSSAPGTGMPTELRAECSTVVGKRLAGVEQFRVCCASITPARDEYIVRDEYIARLFFCFFYYYFFPLGVEQRRVCWFINILQSGETHFSAGSTGSLKSHPLPSCWLWGCRERVSILLVGSVWSPHAL